MPTTLQAILSDPWRLEPTVAVGVGLLTAFYLWAVANRRRFGAAGPVRWGQVACFLLAMAIILLALHPIVDELADRYSFTAHMVQHLVLALVMPIPLLVGTPDWLLRPLTRQRDLNALGYFLTRPLIAFAAFNVFFGFLHIPMLYEGMLNHRLAHVAVHLAVMATGVLMWWPLFGPLPEWPRLAPGLQLLYLVLANLPQSAVGAIIAYSPTVLYPTYLRAPRIGPWTPLEDQAFAALLMWVGGATYTLLALTFTFFRWAASEERREQAEQAELAARALDRSEESQPAAS